MNRKGGYAMLKAQVFFRHMKQKSHSKNSTARRTISVSVIAMALLFGISAVIVPRVRADQFDDQINALEQQNDSVQGSLATLESQASSYQDAISKLQAQISALQAIIAQNIAQQVALQQQIDDNTAKLNQQKAMLSDDIKTMYVDGQPTTIEMLATSKNLSDFVDKEEYRTAVQNKIQDTLQSIRDLQKKLQDQKTNIDALLADQRSQQADQAAAQVKQAQMLAYNQQQQNDYNGQIKNNQSKIADLRAQQAILNARYNIGSFKTSPDHGGYPDVWNNAPQDSLIDAWGMYNRECVSYTAFKVHQAYTEGKTKRDMPYWGGIGNANQWDDNARAQGIPVDSTPTAGSVAISNAGAFGHAMWVEAVSADKTQIYVQQYNQQLDGQYSEGWRYTTGLVFLHF